MLYLPLPLMKAMFTLRSYWMPRRKNKGGHILKNKGVEQKKKKNSNDMDFLDLPGVEDLDPSTMSNPKPVEPTTAAKFSRATLNDRLQELEMLKNKGRGKAKTALSEETTREKEGVKGVKHAKVVHHTGRIKREKKEEKEREEKFKESLAAAGIDPDRYFRLHVTQETEETNDRRSKRKLESANLDCVYSSYLAYLLAFGDEAHYRAYKKRSGKIEFDREEYERQKAKLGEDFYNTNALNYGNEDIKPSSEQLLALKQHVEEIQERRTEYSRRRKWDDNATIDFINERNRNFNAKAKRAYDKYTEEIRENLERGTAL